MGKKTFMIAGALAFLGTFTNCIGAEDNKNSNATVLQPEIVSSSFQVSFNPVFPQILSYSYQGQKVVVPSVPPTFLINGTAYQPEVKFVKTNPASCYYQLNFPALSVSMQAEFTVAGNVLTFKLKEICESGSFAVKTIEIPSLIVFSGADEDQMALANFPSASYASEKGQDHDVFCKVKDFSESSYSKHNKNNRQEVGASYLFMSNGKIASGLYTNVMDENLRMILKKEGAQLSVAPGKWIWREVPHIDSPIPEFRFIVTTDRNGDQLVDWQDAAIAYRENVPMSYGAEVTKKYPISHIAMNFGSQATNPFLRVLDNAKKIWLYTDGLGQRIQYKGYQSEGHDSSHPDYGGNVGRRQGGREDLNFVMRRGHDFNILSGVHINAQEYHKEAKNFNWDIAGKGIGWSWLDESYLTDYRYDSAYGTLYSRLDAMIQDLPWLDFAYLDVFYGRGWPAWRMYTKTNSLGLLQYTEFPGVMERSVIWNHVANDWTQAVWGKGDRSQIARFIYFSEKDTFGHDPLLRGANCDGFMGWHAETNMLKTIKSAFTVNLPTKYLQHFELLKQSPSEASFSNGIRTTVTVGAPTLYDDPSTAEKDDKTVYVAEIFGPENQLLNRCEYIGKGKRTVPVNNLCFIPWDPIKENKIYHWNDKGGSTSWQVPQSWKQVKTAQLYRLTDIGRVFEKEVTIKDGKVELTDILAETPYVLYRNPPQALPDIKWSEGSFVKDTGFDSHTFDFWKVKKGEASIVNNSQNGQTELVVSGADATEIRQEISGLVPGETYAASIWVNIDSKRKTTLSIQDAAPNKPAFLDKLSWKIIDSTQWNSNPKNMFDDNLKTLWHTGAKTELPFPQHVVIGFGKSITLAGFTQTARENLHNGAIKNYSVMISQDGQKWQTIIDQADCKYDKQWNDYVKFDKNYECKFFKIVSHASVNGKGYTSIAELNFDIVPVADSATLMGAQSISIDETLLPNYTDQSSKYCARWHRLKKVFQAPANGKVAFVLSVDADSAKSAVKFDDARLVKCQSIKKPESIQNGNVVLFEDFENVDEGWGPFMYGWKGPMNTHLSESNPPYTDDTIQGSFSLKSRREGSPNMIYRTVPATLELKPMTEYEISLDYLCDTEDLFAFVIGTDKETECFVKEVIKDKSWKKQSIKFTFNTGKRSNCFLGLMKTQGKGAGSIVIDNLLIVEKTQAK